MDENEQKEPMTEPAEAAEQTQEEIKKEEPKQADTKQEDEKKLTESLRVRKIGYMKQQVERQRAAEDLLTEQIMEEQRILDETLGEIDDQIACTEKSRKYNREMQEELNARMGSAATRSRECRRAKAPITAAARFHCFSSLWYSRCSADFCMDFQRMSHCLCFAIQRSREHCLQRMKRGAGGSRSFAECFIF